MLKLYLEKMEATLKQCFTQKAGTSSHAVSVDSLKATTARYHYTLHQLHNGSCVPDPPLAHFHCSGEQVQPTACSCKTTFLTALRKWGAYRWWHVGHEGH